MVDVIKNRVKIIINYEKYNSELMDEITVILIKEGYRLAGTDLSNSKEQRIFYFSERENCLLDKAHASSVDVERALVEKCQCFKHRG